MEEKDGGKEKVVRKFTQWSRQDAEGPRGIIITAFCKIGASDVPCAEGGEEQ